MYLCHLQCATFCKNIFGWTSFDIFLAICIRLRVECNTKSRGMPENGDYRYNNKHLHRRHWHNSGYVYEDAVKLTSEILRTFISCQRKQSIIRLTQEQQNPEPGPLKFSALNQLSTSKTNHVIPFFPHHHFQLSWDAFDQVVILSFLLILIIYGCHSIKVSFSVYFALTPYTLAFDHRGICKTLFFWHFKRTNDKNN